VRSVGIGVSKAFLDLALGTTGQLVRVANDQRGIATLRKRLLRLAVARIVLEAMTQNPKSEPRLS
jgi:hypothetical protein